VGAQKADNGVPIVTAGTSALSALSCGQPLAAATVAGHLGELAPLFDVVVLDACASTNTVLLESPPPDDGRVCVVAAERQTAGRGRRGRSWQAWPGSSLTFSVLWRFPAGAPVPAGLSLVAGIAVARALESLGVGGVALKWPNDVLVARHKLAGILVELLPGRGRTPAAVVGVGLNLRLPEGVSIADQPRVTDLASHLDPLPDRNALIAQLLREMRALFDTYAHAGFAALRGAWQQRNAFAGRPVRIVAEGGESCGVCSGVDEDGALLLATDTGTCRVLSGDVSLRPAE
jgi:BirA family biotin operon repressor/biotin-[acetyl-CoA-carboxylase] ligase